NSRSDAYRSIRVLGVGVSVLAFARRSSKNVPDASHRLQAGSPRPRHRRANRAASSCMAGPFVPSRATSLPTAPIFPAACSFLIFFSFLEFFFSGFDIRDSCPGVQPRENRFHVPLGPRSAMPLHEHLPDRAVLLVNGLLCIHLEELKNLG